MQAADVMSTDVIATTPDTKLRDVARLLLAHGISAVPVLGPDGALLGMVSEGDLASRDELDRLDRRDWWLGLVAEGTAPDSAVLERLQDPERTAGDVMSRPVVSVSETTDVKEIARLLAEHHIKRVPVTRDGRVVGIVSRADLLRVVAAGPTEAKVADPKRRGFLRELFGEYRRPDWEVIPVPPPSAGETTEARLDAAALRALVARFHGNEAEHRAEARQAVARQNEQRAAALLETHVTEEMWQTLLRHAREAAAAGATETMLLRFPNELCTDGGRAIDVAEEGWPATLRGEAAELYLRWERELKHRGFRLAARVLAYPDGKPGDIGLFLLWGE